jgi:hypothetical protein
MIDNKKARLDELFYYSERDLSKEVFGFIYPAFVFRAVFTGIRLSAFFKLA